MGTAAGIIVIVTGLVLVAVIISGAFWLLEQLNDFYAEVPGRIPLKIALWIPWVLLTIFCILAYITGAWLIVSAGKDLISK